MEQITSVQITETLKDSLKVAEEIKKRFHDIPFCDTSFQVKHFVVNNCEQSPTRSYRQIGLQLFNSLHHLERQSCDLQKEDLDIEEKQDAIAEIELQISRTNEPKILRSLERQKLRLELDVKKHFIDREHLMKHTNDAVHYCGTLYAELQQLPEFSRQEIEAGERDYWNTRLQNQLNGKSPDLIALEQTALSLEGGRYTPIPLQFEKVVHVVQKLQQGRNKAEELAVVVESLQESVNNVQE